MEDSSGVSQVYISACANRHKNILLTDNRGFLIYARSKCPIIYDLKKGRIVALLSGHRDEVNSLCLVTQCKITHSGNHDKFLYIGSSSLDHSAIIWRVNIESMEYAILHHMQRSSNCTSICSALLDEDGKFYTVLTGIDGKAELWANGELVSHFDISFYCYTSRLLSANSADAFEKRTLLLLAGSDNSVHIYELGGQKLYPLMYLAGHSDWITCLDVLRPLAGKEELLIASVSQDSYLRVWFVRIVHERHASFLGRGSVLKQILTGSDDTYLVASLETVVNAHEGIISGVRWFREAHRNDDHDHHDVDDDGAKGDGHSTVPGRPLQLVTCSADKTVAVWRSKMGRRYANNPPKGEDFYGEELPPSSASDELWTESDRFGETGETNLPFLAVALSPDEGQIYAHSLRGAIHRWRLAADRKQWVAEAFIGGHHEPVSDLAWERSRGAYLLSCSLDKTCRLHAMASSDDKWHEMARPQVHGHEINCLASLDFAKFASGSDEKAIRTFGVTQFFIKNFRAIAGAGRGAGAEAETEAGVEAGLAEMPSHAQLPALGLSIRGAARPYEQQEGDNGAAGDWYARSKLVESLATIDHLDRLPVEEVLLQSTLWWESGKLFGHAADLYALASDPSGRYLASAAKASRPDTAEVLVWDAQANFRKVAAIRQHKLTVTRLRFSPDGRYLLSVSRDRSWCLAVRGGGGGGGGGRAPAYRKLEYAAAPADQHQRIIWDCCWTFDSRYFATGSRDATVRLWPAPAQAGSAGSEAGCDQHADQRPASLAGLLKLESPVRAIDSLPAGYPLAADCYLFALGCESGAIELWTSRPPAAGPQRAWSRLFTLQDFHHLPLRRLAFAPASAGPGALLASGAEDGIVRISAIPLEGLDQQR